MKRGILNPSKTPRPMTLEEVLNTSDAILELRHDCAMEWHLAAILSTETGINGEIAVVMDTDKGATAPMSADRYGKDWRCWNYSDLIRAMETTPWT